MTKKKGKKKPNETNEQTLTRTHTHTLLGMSSRWQNHFRVHSFKLENAILFNLNVTGTVTLTVRSVTKRQAIR